TRSPTNAAGWLSPRLPLAPCSEAAFSACWSRPRATAGIGTNSSSPAAARRLWAACWAAVEIVKRFLAIRSRTGDLFAVPLCVGIAIGRIGCFFAGLADDTYGKPTSLPWGVNFGDGIPRHPTQLYEVLFLLVLGVILFRWNAKPHTNGVIFRAFMAAYL